MIDSSGVLDPKRRFAIETRLGAGASGTVYKAFDAVRGATVAIKLLTHLDPASLLGFKAEFRSLANIVHPNLLQLYELVARGDEWILSMELIEGGDFLQHVRPVLVVGNDNGQPPASAPAYHTVDTELSDASASYNAIQQDPETQLSAASSGDLLPTKLGRALGELDQARLRSALVQLAEGLHALHRQNKLHRDLKPANVLVSAHDGRVVICDFGLVVEGNVEPRKPAPGTGRAAERSIARYRTDGKVAGTVVYMSPEQMLGQALSPASDWYAMGTMLYQALTGILPFAVNSNFAELLQKKLHDRPVHPSDVDPTLPRDLGDIAMGLLAPQAADRFGYKDVLGRLTPTMAGAHSLPASAASDVLIGRTTQLAQLHGALARSRSGHATVAMVAGRSGMGKSALMRQFFSEVTSHTDAVVLSGRCHEREDLPYKTFDPLMDALSGYLLQLDERQRAELLPEGFHALSRVFPVLRRVPLPPGASAAGANELDQLEQRRRAFAALRELLRRIAQMKPLVLYVDDLQWGDLESGAIFTELLHQPQAPALLFVCAFRSEDEQRSPLLNALCNTHLPEAGLEAPVRVEIDPLAESDARSLALSLLEGLPESARAAELVTREAQGSPFFVGELSSHIRSVGMHEASTLRLDNVLEARFSALSEEERHMLSLVAVAGRPERRGVLERAARETAAKRALSGFQLFHLLESKRLVQSAGVSADDRVESYHDRIREKAYALVGAEERARLHVALAEALVERGSEDHEALFEHYRAAGERQRAGEYAIRAAEKAEQSLAYGRAAALLADALTLLDWTDEPRRALTERLGHALMLAGRGPEAADAFLRALEGASPAKAMELRGLATPQLLRAGLIGRALSELRGNEHVIGMRVPTTALRAVFMLLWRRLLIRLRGRKLKPAPKGGVSAEAIQRMDMLWGIGGALAPMDQLRGTVYQAEHMLLAMRSGDVYRYARALAIESTTYATANKTPNELQRVLDEALEYGGACGHPHGASATKGTGGVCRMLEGRFRDAVRMMREAQQIIRDRLHGTLAWDHTIMVLYDLRTTALLGHVDQVIERVPELLRDAETRGDNFAAVSGRTSHCCWAWLGPDQPELALEQVRLAERRWSADGYYLQHWYTTQALGEIALYRDDLNEAWSRIASEWKRMFVIRSKIQFTRAEILILRARLALAMAKKRDDRAYLALARTDAEALLREGASWIRVHGRLLLASIDSFDDEERARQTLEQVEGQFDLVDMLLMAAVTRYRRGQLTAGTDGEKLIQSADLQMRKLGVKNPAGFLRMLAPGFPRRD